MSAPLSISDARAREIIAGHLDQTLIVEAAAGTGKTTELVHRIIGVIGQGLAEMRGIVAVTFTEKAAGELRLRLRQRLEQETRKAAPEQALRFERAVQTLEEAHVSTIHGFCADLLRERPVEARVDPLFRVLTESQANRLLSETFELWLRANLETPPEGVRRSLRRASRWSFGQEGDGPVERLRRAAIDLNQWRDFRAPWRRDAFDRNAAIARLVDLVHALADVTACATSHRDNLFADSAPVRALSDEIRRGASDGLPHDDDGLESRLVELSRNRDWLRARKGSGAQFAPGIPRIGVLEARDGLIGALHDFRVQADADLAATLHTELLECLDEYERRKEAEGALDFLDLLVRARDLVRRDGEVREHFQQRFTRIFVDEFQDTDPIQAELLLLLAADDPRQTVSTSVLPVPGKLFVVGDPKQSIYRFRRADLAVYRQVCGQLENAGAIRVELRRSFRSLPAIQRFVNAAFALVMDGSLAREQARYVALESVRDEPDSQPAVVALPVPKPYGPRAVSATAIEASLPEATGAFIDWLISDSGWTVTERQGETSERVKIAARHICILFRRFVSYGEDVTRPYLDALEARGVSHLLVGGRAFHAREEIDTLRAALMAIEWPDDQLSVFATLRGALFAIGDEELLEYHHLGGRFHPFSPAIEMPGRLGPVREALDFLADLHRGRNRRSVADTITSLLSATRAHVGIVLRPNGEQALANILHVAELARQYEIEGGMSFRGFVDSLRAEAADARSAEAPILEEGSDGVRLMTVHKAKGLEFPVVILADITARLAPWEASRVVDASQELCALRLGGCAPSDLVDRQEDERGREQAEGERLAYVAATRARDLLVVAGVGDGPWESSWVSPLNQALYPPTAMRRQPVQGTGCPVFSSKDTVLSRPDGDPAGITTVAPGEYRLGEGANQYSVVWWSPEPQVLPLDAPPTFGLRREDLVVKDVPPATVQRYLDDYRAWDREKADAIARAAVPTHVVRTATEMSLDPALDDGSDVTVEQLEVEADRPRGARFGSLVHALLADVPLRASDTGVEEGDALRALVDAHGRLLGSTLDEMSAAERVVSLVLRHPILRSAAAADERGACYRETPVTTRLASGTLVEGTVDLAFDAGGTFIVVDFKTDQDVDESLDGYRRQVKLYASAVAAARGCPARGVLMRI
ncbi:MAG: UvrD-helicase domain-containing protein [Vicinamibacterales bacterium]